MLSLQTKSYIATVGGIITVSMTWMTPLLHSISVNVIVAFCTFTVLPVTVIDNILPNPSSDL